MQKNSSRLLLLAVGLACFIPVVNLEADLIIQTGPQSAEVNDLVDPVDFIIALESESLSPRNDVIWSGWTYQQKICLREAKAMFAAGLATLVMGLAGFRRNRNLCGARST